MSPINLTLGSHVTSFIQRYEGFTLAKQHKNLGFAFSSRRAFMISGR